MKYSKFVFALSIVLVSLLLNVFFGRFLAAKISTIGFFGKLKLLSPQAPVVFNTKEEVRVNLSENLQSAISKSKNKIVEVVYLGKNGWVNSGSGLVVSEDGLLLSTVKVFPETGVAYYAKFSNGQVVAINKLTTSEKSDLVIFQVEKNGLSPVNFGKASDLLVGQNIFTMRLGSLAYQARVSGGLVSRLTTDISGDVWSADRLNLFLGVSGFEDLTVGSPVLDYSGNVMGIFDGSRVVASDYLEHFVLNYLQNNKNIVFNNFGFNYRYVLPYENAELKGSTGVLIVKPEQGFSGLAKQAGLQEGDIIVKVNEIGFGEEGLLENILMDFKTDDILKLSVLRSGKLMELSLGKR